MMAGSDPLTLLNIIPMLSEYSVTSNETLSHVVIAKTDYSRIRFYLLISLIHLSLSLSLVLRDVLRAQHRDAQTGTSTLSETRVLG